MFVSSQSTARHDVDMTPRNTSKKRAVGEIEDHSLAWISTKRVRGDETESLHEAVKQNQLDRVMKLIEENPSASFINLQDSEGNTPLHLAASLNNPRLVELLLDKGANPWSLNHVGLTPVYAASEKNALATVKALTKLMFDHFEPEAYWHDPSQLSKMIKKSAQRFPKSIKARESRVDHLAQKLTGEAISELNDRSELYKYTSHLNSWVGQTLSEDDEGWYFDKVVLQRIRSLCSLLVEDKQAPKSIRGGRSIQEVRELLVDELAAMLGTLRSARRMDALYPLKDKDAMEQLNVLEAMQTVNQLCSMDPGHHLTLPIGFPGHAIYLGMERRQDENGDSIVCHVNNLGAGYPRSHESNNKMEVMPKGFRVPLDDSSNKEEVLQNFVEFVAEVYNCRTRRTGGWEQLYSAISNFQYDLRKICGRDQVEVSHEKEGWKAMKAQTAGNCALKNHSASISTRLGKDLFKWFKEYEKSYVRNRSENLVTNTLFKEKEKEKERALLNSLVSIFPRMKGALNNFLGKSRNKGIASELEADDLAKLIVSNESELLSTLIGLKADVESLDALQNSLLHCAVKAGSLESAEVLLYNGLDVNHQNALGRAPLHIAMEQQNHELAKMLVEWGADPDLQDAEGYSPSDLLQQKMEEGQQIQDLVSRGALSA